MNFRKIASAFALTAVILASVVGVCKQMLVSCGSNCASLVMNVVHMDSQADACGQDVSACAASMNDHLATFASAYPSVATGTVSLFVVVLGAFFVALFSPTKRKLAYDDKLRVKWRSFRRRLLHFIAPNFLVFAFSRGILNAKIFA